MDSHSPKMPTVPAHIAAIERPVEKLMTCYLIKAVLTFVAFPVVFPLLYFRYHTMRYKFDEDGIHMKWGILFRHEIMLNYSRIQDIHLHSSLIERYLGLARIEIQTAAGSSNAEMTLEGLKDHEAMRDFLYSRMRGARDGAVATPQAEHGGEVAALLQEIAGELKAIRVLVEGRRPNG